MNERVVQFRVGVMVLSSLLITAILIVMFGELPTFVRTTYTIHVKFDSAPGVTRDTPIRKSGILIGRVSDVQFAEDLKEGDRGVIVTAQIDRELHDDETLRVQSQLLGDAVIHVVRVDDPRDAREPDGLVFKGQRAPDPVEAVPELKEILKNAGDAVSTASTALAAASQRMGTAAEGVSELIETNQVALSNAIVQATWTLAAIEQTAASINGVIGDEQTRQQIKDSVGRLANILEQAEDTIVLVNTNLTNLQKFTGPLSRNAEQRIAQFDRAVEGLSGLMVNLQTFSRNLNDERGTLGQLVRNPELYNNLSQAARNVNLLTRQLEPIVRDVRIFTDKVARHPGVIVRDAVRPGVGIK